MAFRPPLIIGFIILLNCVISGQDGRNPQPEALEILQQFEKKTKGWTDISYYFLLKVEIPESETIQQKGVMITKGQNYRLDLTDLIFVTDGKAQWVVNKESQEVQIHDYEPLDGENLSQPQNLLAIYKNPDFDYRLIFEGMEGDKIIQQIEFKPLDKHSEYAKAKLTLNQKSGHIEAMELYAKDGTRYFLTMEKVLVNQQVPSSKFVVKKEDFPGFHWEDLRLE